MSKNKNNPGYPSTTGEPKNNPGYPSTTGKPSGKGRDNTKK
jgi:hypothetical protein